MLLVDPASGTIVESNPAARQFYGYSREDFSRLNFTDLSMPASAETEPLKKDTRGSLLSKADLKHKIKSGEIRDVHIVSMPVTIESRKYDLVIVEDISMAKQMETALEKHKHIADHSPAYIGMANMDRQVVYMNREMQKEFGIPPGRELSEYKIFDFYSPAGLTIVHSLIGNIEETGYWKGENEMQTADGRKIPVLQTVVVIKDTHGKPLFSSSMAVNISKQKAAELKIKENEQNLRKGELIGKFGYWTFDLMKREYFFSAGAGRIYGIDQEIISEEEIKAVRLPEYNQPMESALEQLLIDQKPVELDCQIKRKRDRKIVDIHVIAHYDEGKKIIFGSIRDISETRQLERESGILNKQLRNLNARLQNLRTEERNQLAKEMHDKLGQGLIALNFELEKIKKTAVAALPVLPDSVEGVILNVKGMIRDFLELYQQVKPLLLQHLPVQDAIKELCGSTEKISGTEIYFRSNLENDLPDYSLKLTLLKIAAQCLENAIKIAAATAIHVELMQTEKELKLIVRDNGKAYDLAATDAGQYELLEIRELLYAAGGRLDIESLSAGGNSVDIFLPLK